MDIMAQQEQMTREHDAWLDVVHELREREVGDIERDGKDYMLYGAIVKWGEELAELRRIDPMPVHASNALKEKRELYPGRFEEGVGG